MGLGAASAGAFALGGTRVDGRDAAARPGAPFVTSQGAEPAVGPDLQEPPVRASQNGVLETSLTARLGPTTAAGNAVTSRVYEGGFPGPTLRVRPGDTLRVRLVNELTGDDAATNLHVHGMHVSPRDNGDNIFLHAMSGEHVDYEYRIPPDHAAGLYWYHPHVHGDSELQVNNGMVGAIVVEGGLDALPGVGDVTDRLLVLQATQFGPDGVVLGLEDQSNDGALRLINGQLNPTIRLRPGETQRWRILNASADSFFNLALAGHRLHQIAKDGNPQAEVWSRDAILLAPGERVEVLVQGGAAGTYELRTMLFGESFQAMPDVVMATVVVEGEPTDPQPLPVALLPFEDLSEAPVDLRREISFGISFPATGDPDFLTNGHTFDMDRVDQTVKLGALEEWTITNTTDEWHPFHIHVNDYQVVAVNGEPVRAWGHEDTTPVPPGGSITMRTRFRTFTGKFVYHCHLLFHEDHGMMGVIEVVE